MITSSRNGDQSHAAHAYANCRICEFPLHGILALLGQLESERVSVIIEVTEPQLAGESCPAPVLRVSLLQLMNEGV